MILNIDTNTLTGNEAEGAILLLRSLFPSASPASFAPCAPPALIVYPSPQQSAEIDDSPELVQVARVSQAEPSRPQTQPQPQAQPQAQAQSAASPRRPGRPRKDTTQSAQLAASTLPSAEDLDAVAEEAEAKAATTLPAPGAGSELPTVETLRNALDGYIQRHTMDQAISLLQGYGCQRVSEAMALPAEKLSALWVAVNG